MSVSSSSFFVLRPGVLEDALLDPALTEWLHLTYFKLIKTLSEKHTEHSKNDTKSSKELKKWKKAWNFNQILLHNVK